MHKNPTLRPCGKPTELFPIRSVVQYISKKSLVYDASPNPDVLTSLNAGGETRICPTAASSFYDEGRCSSLSLWNSHSNVRRRCPGTSAHLRQRTFWYIVPYKTPRNPSKFPNFLRNNYSSTVLKNAIPPRRFAHHLPLRLHLSRAVCVHAGLKAGIGQPGSLPTGNAVGDGQDNHAAVTDCCISTGTLASLPLPLSSFPAVKGWTGRLHLLFN